MTKRARLFWSAYARLYDQLWDTPQLRDISARISQLLPKGSGLLEVGAGTGLVAGHLRRAGHQVVACEPSASMADRFERRLPEIPLLRVGLGALPSASAPNVIAVNVVHLLDDPAVGVARLRAVCVPNGAVIVVTPDPRAGLRAVAGAQRRAGVHPLRVARFLLWHLALAPLAAACGVVAQVKLDWLDRLQARDAATPVDEGYLLVVLRGTGGDTASSR